MRNIKHILLVLVLIVGAKAQTEDQSSEEVIELSPFSVATEGETAYRAQSSLAGARVSTPLIDPRTAATQVPVAVTTVKRAEAVAIQFVLSNNADKQDVRNQELYTSVEAIREAVKKVRGTKVELREVRFTGGDKKYLSISKGGTTNSWVSVLVLAELAVDDRVADRVKGVRDALGQTKLNGQTKYCDGLVGLYLRNPDQYRREILQKIFDDVEFLKKGFGGEFEILPSGLNGKVRTRVASEAEIELWIDYGITFRSIRELEGAKKK